MEGVYGDKDARLRAAARSMFELKGQPVAITLAGIFDEARDEGIDHHRKYPGVGVTYEISRRSGVSR